MASDQHEAGLREQLATLHGYLDGIEKAMEPAYVLAGNLRDSLFDSSADDDSLTEVLVDQVFGRLGACTDLVAMARGELAERLAILRG